MSGTKTVTSVRSLSYNHLVPKLRHPSNPVCFLDIQIGNVDVGRLSLELFADVCPKTAENFRQFCTGEFKINGESKGYKGCNFNRIIKDFMVQGGDVPFNDGSGMMSIYGPKFADENFIIKHDCPGLLCMANANEKDTNGCQFYITCVRCDFLDGTNVVFGRVVDGMLVLRKMENVPVGPGDKPRLPVTIANCGQL